MLRTIKLFAPSMLLLFISHSSFAQLGFGIRLGGNLTGTDGSAFQARKRIGFQAGADLSFKFHDKIAIQAEPTYHLLRVSNHDYSPNEAHGISGGRRALRYINVPLLLKLNLTSGLALLAGPDLNHLINVDVHRLNNGAQAFVRRPNVGYMLGIDLGNVYFRYRNMRRYNNIIENGHAQLNQFQLGLKWSII
ncbi:outer membrane beta-barrel protein [Sphingobacterium bambusae]|uniref:Outer membrane beta-barrel protein n=1 Tax=Sphingobacterium bambusae TaxID=662858 RepID=A0ABW6B9W4_9SPHI|nr:outer membrane beta-barrel protein [Sphingobacterium bambusae]WPL48594.1 outer membrane beta-barrel protein [Sphingobacterium bambusae]